MFRRKQRMSHDGARALIRQGYVGSPSPHAIFEESRGVLQEAERRGEGVWRCNCINPHAPMPRFHLRSVEECHACGMKQVDVEARDARVVAAREAKN
jgi:hypothetical protein